MFNIELKAKIKSHAMNDDVVFWKWINNTTLGLVTETAVYHWTISDATSPPQKIFDRHANLAGAQIINYRTTSDDKWLVLVGISGNTTNPAAFKVKGAMQLYSRERGVSQPIEGHAAAFAEIKLDGHPQPTKLFTFSVRTGSGAKVRLRRRQNFDPSLTAVLCSCTSSRSTTMPKTPSSTRRPSTSSSRRRQSTTSP